MMIMRVPVHLIRCPPQVENSAGCVVRSCGLQAVVNPALAPLLLLVGETLPVAGPRVCGILHQSEPTEEPLRVGNDALAL